MIQPYLINVHTEYSSTDDKVTFMNGAVYTRGDGGSVRYEIALKFSPKTHRNPRLCTDTPQHWADPTMFALRILLML